MIRKGTDENYNKKCIDYMTGIVKYYIDPVVKQQTEKNRQLMGEQFLSNTYILPTPFEVADYYGIKCELIEMEGDIPSYLNKETKTIYISNKYNGDGYKMKQLCAHELGHYFLHDSPRSAMNDDILNKYLPEEMMKEYEANVFSIILMPQLMSGMPWKTYSQEKLNRVLYQKIMM